MHAMTEAPVSPLRRRPTASTLSPLFTIVSTSI